MEEMNLDPRAQEYNLFEKLIFLSPHHFLSFPAVAIPVKKFFGHLHNRNINYV